jgi:hypothetical protein
MTAKPIPNHPYHSKDDRALRYIIRDAGEAARNMRGLDFIAECKYLDQINDAATVLRYRANARAVSSAEARRSEHFIDTMIKHAVNCRICGGDHRWQACGND